ncbi:MAG: hypothetical protein F6K37_42730 [Moorea sp. SIO4E2]|uniref:hypothetical protein n=1 Tax=Moorena sp. SIO4E2 TaxID=2607826 RepID=UPI0013B8885B|nr:hypothetical protein [Moorena sp. SIO4E2]NEQ12314.1 hypothetical protein [Moorena sp. SIO4E2]
MTSWKIQSEINPRFIVLMQSASGVASFDRAASLCLICCPDIVAQVKAIAFTKMRVINFVAAINQLR